MLEKRIYTYGREDAPRVVILLHGYTGGPDEFRDLAERIALRLDAYVHVPLLPGHGTRPKDLLPISHDDFLAFAHTCIDTLTDNRPYAIFGHSFGAYIALEAALEKSPVAVSFSVLPFPLRMPFSSPWLASFFALIPLWRKVFPPSSWKPREGHVYYRYMPGKAFLLAQKANKTLEAQLPHLNCPVQVIHTQGELATRKSAEAIFALIPKHPLHETVFIDSPLHSIFYTKERDVIMDHVVGFFARAFDLDGK